MNPEGSREITALFLLTCRDCWPEMPNAILPFRTAEERGRWASAHTAATGHASWLVLDV